MPVTINGSSGLTANDGSVFTNASGNVGIGTNSPLATAMLEVSRSTTVIPTATVTADAQVVGWRSRRTGGSFPREYYIGLRENSTALDFYDNTADALRARITSAGDFQFNSGYGSAATAYGCRAWVNFNGTGTVAIRASGNVSSITDNGTGNYTVNFTTAMSDTNYAACVSGGPAGANNECTSVDAYLSASAVRVRSHSGANVSGDAANMNVAIFR